MQSFGDVLEYVRSELEKLSVDYIPPQGEKIATPEQKVRQLTNLIAHMGEHESMADQAEIETAGKLVERIISLTKHYQAQAQSTPTSTNEYARSVRVGGLRPRIDQGTPWSSLGRDGRL